MGKGARGMDRRRRGPLGLLILGLALGGAGWSVGLGGPAPMRAYDAAHLPPQAGAGPQPAVSAGLAHACGLAPTGSLVCWGRNTYGQTTVPASTYSAVSAGGDHTCGLHPDGTLACWGHNTFGQTTVP